MLLPEVKGAISIWTPIHPGIMRIPFYHWFLPTEVTVYTHTVFPLTSPHLIENRPGDWNMALSDIHSGSWNMALSDKQFGGWNMALSDIQSGGWNMALGSIQSDGWNMGLQNGFKWHAI